MNPLILTTPEGYEYTPVIIRRHFVGDKLHVEPLLMTDSRPARKPLTDEQRAQRNEKARQRRALGLVKRRGWSGHWQRR